MSKHNTGQDSNELQDQEEEIKQNSALEQWKFYGQTTLNVSNRRLKNNRFYQKLVVGAFAGVGIGVRLDVVNSVVLLVVGLVGIALSILWMAHIISYKQLNGGKYRVLREMAEDLPSSPFDEEWNELEKGQNPETYITHTSVEIWWPRVTLWVFGLMSIAGAVQILKISDLQLCMSMIWSGGMVLYGIAAFQGRWTPFDSIAPRWHQRKDDDNSGE